MSRLSSADVSSPTVPSPTVTGGDQARARLDALVTELGDDVLGSEVVRNGDVIVRVAAAAWKRAAEVCKSQGYDYFCFLSGIDWMPSTSPNPRASVSDELDTGDDEVPEAAAADEPVVEDVQAEPEVPEGGLGYPTGVAGGDTRFQVFARLYSTTRHEGVTLKADLDPDAPRVDTWSDVYPGADWNERETWEMYGFVFEGHPNLIKLYLPGEFEGFPLRKDFPLLSREVKPWPGLVDVELMPEVPDSEATVDAAPAAEEATADAALIEEATTEEATTEEATAAEAAPAAPPAEPVAPPPAEDSVPETAEEAHATGTESATIGAAAEAASAEPDAEAADTAEVAGDGAFPPDGEADA